MKSASVLNHLATTTTWSYWGPQATKPLLLKIIQRNHRLTFRQQDHGQQNQWLQRTPFCWELCSQTKELYTKDQDQETHTRMSLMLEHSGRLPDNLCFMNHNKSHKNSMCMWAAPNTSQRHAMSLFQATDSIVLAYKLLLGTTHFVFMRHGSNLHLPCTIHKPMIHYVPIHSLLRNTFVR